MGRDYKRSKVDSGRESGGFIALPWVVMDSPAYQALSHPARSMLMEFARQASRDNNGRLLCSRAYLGARGWRSADVIQRAKDELIAAGFIFQTVMGARPNKASWFAVAWRKLDRHPGYDAGAIESFKRGAYRQPHQGAASPLVPSHGTESQPQSDTMKITPLIPSGGTESTLIVPSHGTESQPPVPSRGTIRGQKHPRSVPSDGHHLEKPSVGSFGAGGSGAGESSDAQAIATLAELWGRIGCRSVWRTIRPAPAPAARRPQQRKTARSSDRVEAGRRAMQQAVLRGGARAVNATVGRVGTPPQGAADGDGWTRDRGGVNEPEPWADW